MKEDVLKGYKAGGLMITLNKPFDSEVLFNEIGKLFYNEKASSPWQR